MRLRLFDRIRRLAHRRRPESETAPGVQGRHRRAQRPTPPVPPDPLTSSGPSRSAGPPRDFAPEGEDWPAPSGGPATHGWPSSPPEASPVAEASSAPGALPVPDDTNVTRSDIRSRRAGRVSGSPAVRAGAARARIREAPPPSAGEVAPGRAAPGLSGSRPHGHQAIRPGPAHAAGAGRADTRDAELARAAAGVPRQSDGRGRTSLRAAGAALRTRLPFTAPHARERPRTADGRRNCGSIERILWRQWDAAAAPPAAVIEAVDRLAELPERIKERLADGLDAIFIGPGGVPELDDMTGLRGVPLPAGRATWDACAGAYGERKIVVGSQPSPTPDVMCHEVGHALDDLDSPPGKWQSDSAEFRMVYDQCQPHIASDFHRQPGGLGRKEFFADAFAAIASRQRPALVDMLSGDTRTALRVMLYFNRRYGI
jgi:hypothetical protein